MGVTRQTCVCVGPERTFVPVLAPVTLSIAGRTLHGTHAADASLATTTSPARLSVTVGETSECVERYSGTLVGNELSSANSSQRFRIRAATAISLRSCRAGALPWIL